jgi:hypothetical protein
MKISRKFYIYWEWYRLFRRDWYTGDRRKYYDLNGDLSTYRVLFDFGALTIVWRR